MYFLKSSFIENIFFCIFLQNYRRKNRNSLEIILCIILNQNQDKIRITFESVECFIYLSVQQT